MHMLPEVEDSDSGGTDFGMSGSAQWRGEAAFAYRRPMGAGDPDDWPPKYVRLMIVFEDKDGNELGEWAFCDARRFGRISMANADDPESVEPLSILGNLHKRF